jgi:hypothetical protein
MDMSDCAMRAACLKKLMMEIENETHLNFTGDDFNSRLRIQKTVYLLKVLGVKPYSEYDFGYYVRGPYSPDLARDYYSDSEDRLHDPCPTVPRREMDIVIQAANKGNNFLEAVATLHIAWATNPGISGAETISMVRELKPAISGKLSEAWQFLQSHRMVN